ncbi:hypothetical protein MXB_2995 [Myxobolus squamalis]|nr:hypothetical protein MXB_2995 [Myxobolus squamalis]
MERLDQNTMNDQHLACICGFIILSVPRILFDLIKSNQKIDDGCLELFDSITSLIYPCITKISTASDISVYDYLLESITISILVTNHINNSSKQNLYLACICDACLLSNILSLKQIDQFYNFIELDSDFDYSNSLKSRNQADQIIEITMYENFNAIFGVSKISNEDSVDNFCKSFSTMLENLPNSKRDSFEIFKKRALILGRIFDVFIKNFDSNFHQSMSNTLDILAKTSNYDCEKIRSYSTQYFIIILQISLAFNSSTETMSICLEKFKILFQSEYVDTRPCTINAIRMIIVDHKSILDDHWNLLFDFCSSLLHEEIIPSSKFKNSSYNEYMGKQILLVIQLVFDQCIKLLSLKSLICLLALIKLFALHTENVNNCLVSSGYLMTLSDHFCETSSKNLHKHEVIQFWREYFKSICKLCSDPRMALRKSVIQMLFNIIEIRKEFLNFDIMDDFLINEIIPLLKFSYERALGSLDLSKPTTSITSDPVKYHHSRNTPEKQWMKTYILLINDFWRFSYSIIKSFYHIIMDSNTREHVLPLIKQQFAFIVQISYLTQSYIISDFNEEDIDLWFSVSRVLLNNQLSEPAWFIPRHNIQILINSTDVESMDFYCIFKAFIAYNTKSFLTLNNYPIIRYYMKNILNLMNDILNNNYLNSLKCEEIILLESSNFYIHFLPTYSDMIEFFPCFISIWRTPLILKYKYKIENFWSLCVSSLIDVTKVSTSKYVNQYDDTNPLIELIDVIGQFLFRSDDLPSPFSSELSLKDSLIDSELILFLSNEIVFNCIECTDQLISLVASLMLRGFVCTRMTIPTQESLGLHLREEFNEACLHSLINISKAACSLRAVKAVFIRSFFISTDFDVLNELDKEYFENLSCQLRRLYTLCVNSYTFNNASLRILAQEAMIEFQKIISFKINCRCRI